MKKRTTVLISVTLILAIVQSVLFYGTTQATALEDDEVALIGDVDLDTEVTIVDATVVQRKLAGLRTLDELQVFLGDTDGDRELTIVDATLIQRYLADLGDRFYIRGVNVQTHTPNISSYYTYVKYPQQAYSPYQVMVDTNVDIRYSARTVTVNRKPFINRYDVFIDDVKVADDTEDTVYKTTFRSKGVYSVKIIARNAFGEGTAARMDIKVTDSPNRPYIADALYNTKERTLSARASGGAGDYRYRFYIKYIQPAEPTDAPTEEPWEPLTEEPTEGATSPPFNFEPQPDGTFQMVSDYTDASTIRIPDESLNTDLDYLFYVNAIDKNGVESTASLIVDQDD